MENLLPQNIGSNEFHQELEQFLVANFNEENLMNIVNLIKGLSLYTIKEEELNKLLFKFIADHVEDFSIKQLEILLWSISRKHLAHNPNGRGNSTISEMAEYEQESILKLVNVIKNKSASMKPRGVAFAIESFANLGIYDEDLFKRMERVVLAKIDDFIPHYTIKVMQSFFKQGFGSGELYDALINKILEANEQEKVKYSDLLKFYEIYPEVNYIYDNTMSEEHYKTFVKSIGILIKDKKFPTEDVCKVFNILIRISPYTPQFEENSLQ